MQITKEQKVKILSDLEGLREFLQTLPTDDCVMCELQKKFKGGVK